MAKKRLAATNKGIPVIFNGNCLPSDRQEQEWIADLLRKGKTIACPSEIGIIAMMRADGNLKRKLSAFGEDILANSWALGLGERSECWKYLVSGENFDDIERILRVFWPGPLFLNGIATDESKEILGDIIGRKVNVWMPYNSICNAIIRACNFPIVLGKLRFRDDIFPLSPQDVAEKFKNELELVIENRDISGKIEHTILDISNVSTLRLVHRGQISIELLRKMSKHPLILSGEACDAVVGSHSSGIHLIIFEGPSERVVRRMRMFADNLESSESIHYFVHSDCAMDVFKEEKHIYRFIEKLKIRDSNDPFAWQKLGLELWQKMCRIDKEHDNSVILLEGVPRDEHTEEFMERLTRSAYQVINMFPSER